jgi:hypothetical protein
MRHLTGARVGPTFAGFAPAMGDDGRMDQKNVKIIAVLLIVCLIGMVFIGFF